MRQITHALQNPEEDTGAVQQAQVIALRAVLRARLLTLSFHAFEACICDLLRSLGYQEVRLLSRTQWKQPTRHGGKDLEAKLCAGVSGAPLLVQVKQYERTVSRRFIDELRGTILRTGGGHGLIVTTSGFSAIAQRAAASDHVTPIRLVGREELLDLLCLYQIGVVQERKRGEKRLCIDEDYFRALQEKFPPAPRVVRQAARGVNNNHKAGGAAREECCRKGGGMLWHTHAMGGVASLWALHLLPGGLTPDTLVIVSGCAVLGGLLPDLDAAEAKIKHLSLGGVAPFALLSTVLHQTLGHRGLLHSLPGVLLVSLVAFPMVQLLGWQPWAALILGYSSHIALDSLTPSGVPLLLIRDKRQHLLPRPLRITTGSPFEEIVFVLLSLAALWLLLTLLTPVHSA